NRARDDEALAHAREKESHEREKVAHEREKEAHEREKLAHAQADVARTDAEKKSAESQERLVRLYVTNGLKRAEEGDTLGGLPWLAEALKEDHGKPQREEMHRVRLTALLEHCPRLAQMWVHGPYMIAHRAVFSPDGKHVLIATGMPSFISGHSGDARI